MEEMPLLFSYGTLQQPAVQIATLGRALAGSPDELVGFELAAQTVANAAFVAASGKSAHANAIFNGRSDSRVNGMLLEVTDQELLSFDAYELPVRYLRRPAVLVSGKQAWVYTFEGR
jgi:gamma-glutamylcyclotransferase (GGCT)/AIG2-like uncharacterized protein YtfP